MTMIRRTALAALILTLALTVAAEAASAQSGPAPGYEDPYAYMADHAQDEVDDASSEPVEFVGDKASAEGVANETEHAAWWTCWTADHEADTDAAGACDAYYTPPEAAAPDQPADDQEPPVADPVDDRVDDALDTVDEVVDAVGDLAEEPGSAGDQVQRIVTAVTGFVDRTVFGLLGFVEDVVDFAAEALGIGGGLMGEGAQSVGDGVLGVSVGLADGALDAAGQSVDAVAAGAAAVGSGVEAAASGAVDAVDGAASGVGHAVGDAGQAVGEAVDQVVEAVRGLFEPSGGQADVPDEGPVDTPVDADDVKLPDLGETVDKVL